jgi:hypothetical protein
VLLSLFPFLTDHQEAVIMKNSLVIAAAALLGASDAAMHRMKLQKVPLEDQLVRSALPSSYHVAHADP